MLGSKSKKHSIKKGKNHEKREKRRSRRESQEIDASNNDPFDSLTEGIFYVKPTKPVTEKDDFVQLNLREEVVEPLEFMHIRRHKMEETLKQVNQLITDKLEDLDRETIQNIADFIQLDHFPDPLVEIATALVYTSTATNPDDYIPAISTALRERQSRVAVLKAKDSTSLKATMQSIMEQWMVDSGFQAQDEEDVEMDIGPMITQQRSGIARFDPDRLTCWWNWMRQTHGQGPILSLIIPSPLALPTLSSSQVSSVSVSSQTVLPDLIFLLHRLAMENIPFRLIFLGLPPHTALESNTSAGGSWSGGLTDLLPASCLRLLNYEKFWVARGQECVAHLIETLWLQQPLTWQPTSDTFLKMWDRFDLGGGGVAGFVNAIHFSIMIHFYSNPLSIFTPVPGVDLDKHLLPMIASKGRQLMDAYVDLIKCSSQSLMKRVERWIMESGQDVELAQDLHDRCKEYFNSTSQEFLNNQVPELLGGAWQYVVRRRCLYNILTRHILPTILNQPNHASRNISPGKLFENIMSFDPKQSPDQGAWVGVLLNDVRNGWSLETKSTTDSPWYQLLTECQREWSQALEEFQEAFPEGYANWLIWDLQQQSRLLALITGDDRELSKDAIATFVSNGIPLEQVNGQKRDAILLKLVQSRQNKVDRKTERSKRVVQEDIGSIKGTWNHFVLEAMAWLQDMIITIFTPPECSDTIGFELVSTSCSRDLGVAFAPQLRAYQHTALTNPCPAYIACQCCNNDNALPTLPDITICHRLLDEHGNMVNLADWGIQFRETLRPHERPGSEEDDSPEEELWCKLVQARFVRCVEDLVWMGYLRKTKRKKDHVEKCL